jgi:DNA-binding transcriptional LysR family regulator
MHWADRIGRRIKLRDLNILLTVVQCGSMAKAAGQLSVSNPVVSKAIADLERAVGSRLLDRSPQGVEPTIYGRALLERGLIAFDELRQAVKRIEFLADPTEGEVRIGASIVIASGFVTAVVDRMSRLHPRIVFHLMAGESAITYRALEERNVDLVIARIFGPVAEQRMQAENLCDEFDVVVAGAQNPWTKRRRVKLSELMNEPWTLPPPDSLNGPIAAEAFRASRLDVPRATVITSTIPVRNALLATGRFLTIVPNSVLRFSTNCPQLKRLPIELKTKRRPIGIITLKNRTLSPVAQLFIDCARELAKLTEVRPRARKS